MSKTNIGLIGLGVMGANLARNIARNGFPISVYNRTTSVTEQFIEQYASEGEFSSAKSLEDFVSALEAPRQVIIMVKAGKAVDAVIDQLLPLLDKGDAIIDGGNSYYPDTLEREQRCAKSGIHFIGMGISGGEEGALHGPSLMPGGKREAWELIEEMAQKIAAKADGPCVTYVGPGGAGHFVKMVQNGIEYADMQLIAEIYQVMRDELKLSPPEIAEVFRSWNEGPLASYLIEISADIFEKKDDGSDAYLVDLILDKAGQKGTGRWTVKEALDLGVPVPTITAAVEARIMSSQKTLREKFSARFADQSQEQLPFADLDRDAAIALLEKALYAGKILSYAQGMDLILQASREFDWGVSLSEVARIWKGGCIIRAAFLSEIQRAFKENASLEHLLFDEKLSSTLEDYLPALREVVLRAAGDALPIPALQSALSYFDALRSKNLPQNLTQAQRDYFGAHTFERIDREGVFHADWQ